MCGAIARYYNAGLKVNIEWVEEYNELVECVGKHYDHIKQELDIEKIKELYAIGHLKKEEKFNKLSLAKFNNRKKDNGNYD